MRNINYIDKNIISTLNRSCIIFDVETTGLSKENDRIIEIAAVKIKNETIHSKLELLINPGKSLPYKIVELTKITDYMLLNKPLEHEVVNEIYKFMSDAELIIGHNVTFDLGFLNNMFLRNNIQYSCDYLDTLQLTKKYIPGLSSYKLGNIVKELGYIVEEDKSHRALYDVNMTLRVLAHLSKIVK